MVVIRARGCGKGRKSSGSLSNNAEEDVGGSGNWFKHLLSKRG